MTSATDKPQTLEIQKKEKFQIKRKVVQFFTHGALNLALCNDGCVYSFTEGYNSKGKETIFWKRREALENPGEAVE